MKRSYLPVLLVLVISLTACLSSQGDGGIQLTVHHSRRPVALKSDAALPSALQIKTFRVAISGPGINPPIEVFFPSEASGGTISGIPKGADRVILIEALNEEGQVVRRRELEGIQVEGGEPTSVQASLLTVPWITNLSDGSSITNTRLIFNGYGEPGSRIEISDNFDGSNLSLSTAGGAPAGGTANSISAVTPSLSDGQFSFRPSVLSPGLHEFEILDPQSGESSAIQVTLTSPGRQPGALMGPWGGVREMMLAGASLGNASEVMNNLSQPTEVAP